MRSATKKVRHVVEEDRGTFVYTLFWVEIKSSSRRPNFCTYRPISLFVVARESSKIQDNHREQMFMGLLKWWYNMFGVY